MLANAYNSDGDTLTGSIVTAPSQGTMAYDATTGLFNYTPTSSSYTGSDSFTYAVCDGTLYSNTAAVSISINPVNHAPTGTNNTVTSLENAGYVFSAADFGFSDPNDTPANNLLAVEITTLPTLGTLTDDGVAVTAGQFVNVGDISDGLLVYTPPANTFGAAEDGFTFRVQDDGGTAYGGVDTDPSHKATTINVIGNNTTVVGQMGAGNLSQLIGNVVINGGLGGDNSLTVNDNNSPAGQTVTLTPGTISWGAASNIQFSNISSSVTLNIGANGNAQIRITQTDFQAGFQFADFVGDPDRARRRINRWVEDKTNKKIEDLILERLLDSTTRLVLVNAVYFKADWAAPFPKVATKPDDFALAGGAKIRVLMMNQTIVANYMANADFQLAELPYKDNEVSMVLILPKKNDGLPQVENKLSVSSLKEALALVDAANLQVAMPRFKMTETFSLGGELAKMGMQEAFHSGRADFSGMNNDEKLFISAVAHKAFVDVNETGTEAAAATGVVEVNRSKSRGPIPFRVDQPFLFLLRHNSTGSILFIGRVSDPRDN